MRRSGHSLRKILPLAKGILLVPVTPLHAALADGESTDVLGPTPYFDLHGLLRVASANLNRLRQVCHNLGDVPFLGVFPSALCDLGSVLFGHGRSFYQSFAFKLGHYLLPRIRCLRRRRASRQQRIYSHLGLYMQDLATRGRL